MKTEMKTRRDFVQTVLAAGVTSVTGSAFAQQDYPSKPIKWLVGYPPGSGSDNAVRVVAEAMSRDIGQSMVIDNRPGAAGSIAAAAMTSLPADGYSLLCMDMGTYSLAPYFYKKLGYDPVRDFRMVGTFVSMPMVLVVPASLNVSTVAEFVKLAKSKPAGSFNFGTSGAGNITHLTMELFMRQAGIEMTHVPYKGSTLGVADLAAERIEALFCDANTPAAFVHTGKAKILAVASSSRLSLLPNVPTLKEAGFNVEVPYWLGVAVLRSTPDSVVQKLNESLNKVMRDPQMIKKMGDFGLLVTERSTARSSDEFAQSDMARVHKYLKDMNIKID